MNLNKKIFLLIVFFLITKGVCLTATKDKSSSSAQDFKNVPIKIGFFYGGRCALFFRAFINGYFKAEGLNVELYTNAIDKGEKILIKVPDTFEMVKKLSKDYRYWGKMSRRESIDKIMKGELDGTCVGATSFSYLMQKKLPIVAVAGLGHGSPEKPSRGLVMRNGIKIGRPEDLKGKKIGFIDKDSGDELFLRDFIKRIGLKNGDIKLIDIKGDIELESLARGEIDGCFLHYGFIQKVLATGHGYLYKEFDFVNPGINYALLVFRKDFIERNFNAIKKLVKAYEKRIKFEQEEITEEERQWNKNFGVFEGLFDAHAIEKIMKADKVLGFEMTDVDNPPVVRIDLLGELQGLMLEHGFIKKKVNIENYVDRRFVN